MKAYQIRIELLGSDPLIWRRVIMPADATFNRLHDVIQNVTNFQGGYPVEGYHLFAFDLSEENMSVTNDDQAYQEHKDFMKHPMETEEKIRENATPEVMDLVETQLSNLKTVVRKPAGIKIDSYIEKYGEIFYMYDYGDDWRILVTLEQTTSDYKYGYPTLIDGAETAPPEDVGGLPGYYEFLKSYRDENHPQHNEAKSWAESQGYREYDPKFINIALKGIQYKKNEP